ncbi:HNH/ENDO VII family nuclease [Halovivax asiaticus]|uniref:HNH/ENDO VII family nuclease n=1 Tax=Halovivax asiaticus TaxID=332953 RepID=UPI000A0677B4
MPPCASGQVKAVWQRAKQESPDGTVRDPNKPWIVLEWDRSESRADQWHMGHKENREYRHLLEYYLRDVISERELVNEYHDPHHYRPEAPKENSSRKHEGDGEYWVETFGPLPEGDDSR